MPQPVPYKDSPYSSQITRAPKLLFQKKVAHSRLNVILPHINRSVAFGGVSSAVELGRILARDYDQLRVLSLYPLPGQEERIPGHELAPQSMLGSPESFSVEYLSPGQPLKVHSRETFLCTFWSSVPAWEAYRDLLQSRGLPSRPFLYFIQDFEPGFYPFGHKYTRSMATYGHGSDCHAILNSRELALNEKFIPSGPLETLEREELLRNYTPEAKLFTEKLLPAVRLMTKAIAKGERLRERGKPYNAELEFRNALVLDENNVRANFGLGMTLMDQGNEDESGQIFERLMDQDETFKPDNKHLFNEYGMRLRKNGMFDKALRYYDKAYILSDRDEHLLYNIARTHYERGAHDDALLFADKALAINPGLKAASDLKAIIQNQQ